VVAAVGLASFGVDPAGPAGYTLPTAAEPGPALGVAFVDQNGDVLVDGTGDVFKTTATRQRVLTLLRTEIGSVLADAALGITRQPAIDRSWDHRMRRAVELALKPMTDDGSIRIDRIAVERPLHFRASIEVSYTVLAENTVETVAI
jgi:hypothetical protein